MRALVVVDVQNDFCEGGALGVNGGNSVAQGVADLIRESEGEFDLVITTQDWHDLERSAEHFEKWPVHCVAGTPGAELHPVIEEALSDLADPTKHVRLLKGQGESGQSPDGYSGWEGITDTGQTMDQVLRADGTLYAPGDFALVTGIATDYCVRATALDLLSAGFEVAVARDLVAGVNAEDSERALGEIQAAYGVIIDGSVE